MNFKNLKTLDREYCLKMVIDKVIQKLEPILKYKKTKKCLIIISDKFR